MTPSWCLENIYRYIEEGMEPFAAAIKGVREIGFAVVAMTLTLVAVFAPLAFTPGRTGRLFAEFALALAGSVMVSGVVALSLSPMMCSKLLKHNPDPSFFDRGIGRMLDALTRGYGHVLLLDTYRLASGAAYICHAVGWWLALCFWRPMVLTSCSSTPKVS
jgi:multidrug efflux pump